jgi:hypothetical protein
VSLRESLALSGHLEVRFERYMFQNACIVCAQPRRLIGTSSWGVETTYARQRPASLGFSMRRLSTQQK